MKKIAMFAFNGEAMCFVHALLNAVNFHEKGYDIKLVIEGSAVKQVKQMAEQEAPFSDLYQKVRDLGLIDCVCRACSHKMGSLKAAEDQGLTLGEDLKGHPSMETYIKMGYDLIVL